MWFKPIAIDSLCRDTWVPADHGSCIVHQGKACLIRPSTLLSEYEKLKALLSHAPHGSLCDTMFYKPELNRPCNCWRKEL